MPMKFSVVGRRKPNDPTSPYFYYPRPVSSGKSDFKSLARQIQKTTGQNYADVIGVLAALEDILPDQLKQGMILQIGDIGRIYVTYKTLPAPTAEEVQARHIEEVRVRFQPNKVFLAEVNHNVTFVKVASNTVADEPPLEET